MEFQVNFCQALLSWLVVFMELCNLAHHVATGCQDQVALYCCYYICHAYDVIYDV